MSAVLIAVDDDVDEEAGEVWSLAAFVRARLEASSEPNPRVIARQMVDDVPDEHLRSALEACLPMYVAHAAGNLRRRSPAAHDNAPNVPGGRAAAVTVYTGILAWRERVVEGWKMLGDCTKADLLFAADLRIENAKANTKEAAKFRHLAKKMNERQKVADLPLGVVEEVLR